MTCLNHHGCRPGYRTEDFPNAYYFTKTAVCEPIEKKSAKISGKIWAFKARWFYSIGTLFVFLKTRLRLKIQNVRLSYNKTPYQKWSFIHCCQNCLGNSKGDTWYWKTRYINIGGKEATISSFEPSWFQQHEPDQWLFIHAAPKNFSTVSGFFSQKALFFFKTLMEHIKPIVMGNIYLKTLISQ